ncbi:unnamed protein product [Clonostachys byssicola]|uniref:N-acetylgalactosaminide beta-1,3-galactosyltransferase n=1 Tax=Clonostachys byssicola TaxID=160290 RepID=A0A9N9UN49_9HYPO|nr:unnamed protein product [Clonostachys byssicola]
MKGNMVVTYRNNRLVPAVIMATCIIILFWLVDPSVENYGHGVQKTTNQPPHQIKVESPEPLHTTTTKSLPSAPTSAPLNSPSSHVEDIKPVESKTPKPVASVPAVAEDDDDDILLIMKTGGTTMWKRLLVHLSTTLSRDRISPKNIVIYSDLAEKVGEFTIIDVLANMTDEAKQAPDFDVYRQQPEYNAHNFYVEAAGVNGDEWGPQGGWIIDKYKFVPLVQHAGENWPKAKWYVYMEDDAYLFLPSIRRYLSGFDWKKPHWLGSYAAKSDVVFAQGGAGFALSRGAWEASFGKNPNMAETFYNYTAERCCGDQVLGYALNQYGVKFGENDGEELFTWGFNPLVHWAFSFSRSNWCYPLMSWHKTHSRDVAQYYELEKRWDFSKPFLHRDFFNEMILPHIEKPAQWWENGANQFSITSDNQKWPPAPEDRSSYDEAVWKQGWQSAEACEAACISWTECMMWSFTEDLCKMDDKIAMGQGYAPGMSQRKTSLMHTSGWMTDRLPYWKCI